MKRVADVARSDDPRDDIPLVADMPEASPFKRSNSNPFPQSWGPPTTYATRSDKIIIVMVGLPARGKSYISRRLSH